MDKIKFIYGLVAVLITLIFLSVVFDLSDKFSDELPPVEYKKSEIADLVFEELTNFGINEEWITKKRIWNNAPDSIKYYYKIKVPIRLTIPEILLPIQKRFNELENIVVDNDEFEINGISQLQILSNNKIKFRAHFNYDKDAKRIRPNISFIVSGIEELAEIESKQLLEISYPCAIMLAPSKKTKDIIDSLSKFDKDFVVLINDNVSGDLYEMDSGFSKNKIRRSISNIVSDFKNSSKYFVDQDSDIFKSVMFSYIKDEFARKKVVLYRLSTLKNVSKKSEAEKLSFLQYHFNDVESNERKVFYITAEDYISLQPYIEKFKRMGNRFIPLSEE